MQIYFQKPFDEMNKQDFSNYIQDCKRQIRLISKWWKKEEKIDIKDIYKRDIKNIAEKMVYVKKYILDKKL